MAARTIEFFHDFDLIVMLTSAREPSAAEWTAYTSLVGRLSTTNSPLRGLLVVSEGGKPDAKQRAQAAAAYGDHAVPLALCINSALVRGALASMRWVYRGQIAGFEFDNVEGALAHLKIAESRWPGLRDRICKAQTSNGWRAVAVK